MADSKKPLRKLRKRQNQALDRYSEAIRSDLSKLDRLKFKAIVVIEIHARDVIERMYKTSEYESIRRAFLLSLDRIASRAVYVSRFPFGSRTRLFCKKI